MSHPKRLKTPWQIHVEKRAHKNKRLVRMASQRLSEREFADLPPSRQLGMHLGLITLANCSARVVDIRARARWMLHWMLGYLIAQGFDVEDAATENALDACEALMLVAAQSKEKQPGQLQFRYGRLLHADGTPVQATWVAVYDTAWQFIGALDNIA